jgi:geranylgeranyl diphosphate synthase, type II
LYEGKRTLVLIHLVHLARGADRRTIQHYIGLERDERSAALVEEVRGLIDDYGSIDFARAYAGGIAGAAEAAFDDAFGDVPPGSATGFLRSLIPYMLGRRS